MSVTSGLTPTTLRFTHSGTRSPRQECRDDLVCVAGKQLPVPLEPAVFGENDLVGVEGVAVVRRVEAHPEAHRRRQVLLEEMQRAAPASSGRLPKLRSERLPIHRQATLARWAEEEQRSFVRSRRPLEGP